MLAFDYFIYNKGTWEISLEELTLRGFNAEKDL